MGLRENKLLVIKDNNKIERLESPDKIKFNKSSRDIFVTPKADETLHKLANRYYGDSALWWVIASANNLRLPFNIPRDIILRIPPKNGIRN